MPRTIKLHTLQELSDNKDEILLETKTNTELHIIAQPGRTIIKMPFGNKFDIIDGCIVIHEKQLPGKAEYGYHTCSECPTTYFGLPGKRCIIHAT